MKLLLTSEGLSNKEIEKAFFKLVEKPAKEIHVAYIPTAVNAARTPHKEWLINTLIKFNSLKIGTVDIADISAIPENMWLPKLKKADVIYVEGGNIYFLKYWFKKSGLDKKIKSLLKNKVYVGASAGSMILGEKLFTRPYKRYSKTAPKKMSVDALRLVDFCIRPHFSRSDREEFTEEKLTKIAIKNKTNIYALDDNSAIMVNNKETKVISTGNWKNIKGK